MMNIVETARKEGIEKGIKKGQKEHAVAVAKAMIKDHLPLEPIIKYSGLTKQEVLDLMKYKDKA